MNQKKTTKAQRIRAYLSANPNATAKEISSACDATLTNVYQVKYAIKKETKPPRAYRKKTINKKVSPKILKVTRTKEDVNFSESINKTLIEENANFKSRIKSLENQAVGYRAVIDFLEYQLNLRRNNNGATV
jgi:hypothetical protein